ncbi:MAG: GIY-YIG nuclease family protein [Solirubrobacteraceae bacterium]
MTAEEIVEALHETPLFSIPEAKRPTGIPGAPGCYSWWCPLDALPGVPATPHPSEAFGLLYVGIAPRDTASSARLRSRLCRQHIGGNVGSSTFRFGLAALLWEQERWTPRTSASGKFKLARLDNRALSEWQITHLRLRWAVTSEPWHFEKNLIRVMQPPMNRDHNEKHPFYKSMGDARDRFRQAARTTPM